VTPEERRAHEEEVVTKYLSWGSVVTFKSEVAALDLWIAGPAETAAPPGAKSHAVALVKVRTIRVFVPGDYLRLGLDDSERAASFITRRTRQILKQDPTFNVGNIYALDKPIKPENIGYAKPVAERIGFTPEMERAWMGGLVALEEFYKLANQVPELKENADIVSVRPPLWKLAKLAWGAHFKTGFGGMDRGPLNSIPDGIIPVPFEVFDVPFAYAFDKDRIVSGAMLVTRPLPPLDVGAGIIAIIAVHPDDKTRAVELRAIASARGPARASERPPVR
jgi:hypothetical protein